MSKALFVVGRESVEALLILGILYAWLQKNKLAGGMRALGIGVLGGIGLALLLGLFMVAVQNELSDQMLEWFQIGMLFIAAGLITQMVLWTRKHARSIKPQIEATLAKAASRRSLIGIAIVAALAVAREGAETAIFLYGLSLDPNNAHGGLLAGSLLGLLLAIVVVWAASRSLGLLNKKLFFAITSFLLLILAAGLFATGLDRLIGSGLLNITWPFAINPLWDSSSWLSDSSTLGKILADTTGYRAQPTPLLLLAYITYWSFVALWWKHLLPSHQGPSPSDSRPLTPPARNA